MPRKVDDLVANFFSKIEVSESGCWLWISGLKPNGYGVFCVNRRPLYAHRWSYEYHKGPIPEGLHIDHLCKVRHCVNPEHLEAVTARVNLLRSNSPTGLNARKEKCPKGHEYTLASNGKRFCSICERERVRSFYVSTAYHRATHCPKGHPYDETNTVMYTSGHRCRACRRERNQRQYYKLPPSPRIERTHCIHGHPYNDENTRVSPKGKRICRVCEREWDKRHRLRSPRVKKNYSKQEWEVLKKQYDYICLRCGRQEPEIVLQADHIIPRSLNGSNLIENIQPLCPQCNSWKRAQIIDFRAQNT